METQQQSMKLNYQTSTSSLEDFLAELSQWQEKGKDLTKQEGLSFLMSQGFLPTKNQGILYSKMLKVYFLTTKEKLSRQYLGFSPTWGISLNGNCSIVRTTESHRVGKECILSDILEDKVDQKYFLSEKGMEYLKRAEKRRGKGVAKFHQR